MSTYATRQDAELAAEKKSLQMLETGETIEFEGQNCEIECDGWDGSHRRCECGNRRVSWDFNEYPKGAWKFYAAAY